MAEHNPYCKDVRGIERQQKRILKLDESRTFRSRQRNRRFLRLIKKIWLQAGKTYGSPRIHQQLLRQGEQVSRPRVARLMAKEGIQSQIRSKWVTTTDPKHKLTLAPNLLDRAFTPEDIRQVWVSDITYIPSNKG